MTTKEKNSQLNKKGIVSAVFFIGIILVFTLISIVKPKSDFSEAENRALQELPGLDVGSMLIGDFQQQYEDYLSDQFVGREFFVNATNKLMLGLGKSDVKGVYLGKDDYLIEKYAMSDFNETVISDNIWYLSEYLKAMKDMYGEGHVHALMIPSKGTVYGDKMPEYAMAFDTSFVVNELSEAVEDENLVVDLTDSLLLHNEEEIYYKTDHHWTSLGAYYTYNTYKTIRGEQAPALSDYQVNEVSDDFYGSTYDKVQIKKSADVIQTFTLLDAVAPTIVYDDGRMTSDSYYEISYLDEKDKYSYYMQGNFAKVKISTGTKNGKCLLLLKDSFSNCFVPFLAQDFETIYMIDLRYVEGDIHTIMDSIHEECEVTDVLAMYNVEKFMKDDSMWKLE